MSRDAGYWDAVVRAESPGGALWRAHSDAVNLRLLADWLPRAPVDRGLKTDLFDEAVGQGLHARLTLGARAVIGMDVSSETARAAVARHRGVIALAADARGLPFMDEAFDLVLSNSTLDHFGTRAELAASVREIHRVLRPRGTLIITLDNRANPAVALRNAIPFALLKRLKLVPYYVGVTCGPRGLRGTLREAGFQVVDTRAILHCPRALAVAAAGVVDGRGGPSGRQRFLRMLMAFEQLARWPTRFATGYFVAALASKR